MQSAQPQPAEAEELAEGERTGTLRLVVFYGEQPVADAVIRAAARSQQTNVDGAAELTLDAGMHEVRVAYRAIAPDGRVADVTGSRTIGVVAGETSEAIVVLPAFGASFQWDVEGPSEQDVEAAVQVAEATEYGRIQGTVASVEDGEPVPAARVFVRGVDVEGVTDEAGRFELRVPVGTHTLSLIQPQFSTLSKPDVEVRANAATRLQLELTPVSVRMDDFIVTAPHIEGSVAGLMEERRSSASVSDAIGREDIAKMPANDAAQAAQRVVGATIVGGRFVYVRGLGERYSNALLNGGPLPSPEPDRATVPLDLFPAKILESVDIVKTFTPDVPGDFAGGSVRIVTRGVPDELLYNMSLSTSYNSQSSFQRVYSHRGGSLDALGFDDGGRALSSEIPGDYILTRGTEKPDGDYVLNPELNELAEAVNTPMAVRRQRFGPDVNGSVLIGNGWKLGGSRRFGLLGSLVYRRGFDARREVRRVYQVSSSSEDTGGLQLWSDYDVQYANESVRWGSFATSILELARGHTLKLHGSHSQLADKETTVSSGFQQNEMSDFETTRLAFASRGLTSGQLQGEHEVAPLNDALIEWRVFLSRAVRDQPDTRDLVHGRGTGAEAWSFVNSPQSGRHFFSNQSERARGGALDWTQPLLDGDFTTKLKLGTMISSKKRDFRSRRLALQALMGSDRTQLECGVEYDPIECPERLFADENIGNLLTLAEGFRAGDAYNATLNVYAGYAMVDAQLGEHWRVLGGARLEQTQQELIAVDPFLGKELEDERTPLSSLDVLPAASVVFSPLQDINIRSALSQTLARPQLRELAPFTFSNYFGGVVVSGFPELELTHILNADVRFEWYPTAREVLAMSVFAKKFEDPIEPIMIPSSTANTQTYRNAKGARLFGVEIEARKTLEFVSEALEDFTVIGSLMIARSEIEVQQTGTLFLTNTSRPMVNQAPYVVNLSLDYENENGTQARVLYNVSGHQIVEVGSEFLDDAYLHPRHMLDVTASQRIGEHFKLRINGRNLLNAQYLVTQGKENDGNNVRRRYREGVSVSVGASYSY